MFFVLENNKTKLFVKAGQYMRTLLVGNTGYITNKFVEEAFPESLVMVMGDTSIRKNRKKNLFVRPFVKNEKELKDIFIQ